MCAKRILLLLLFPLVEASHASLQSVLSAERREYVLDEHGRASPVMRREGLVTRRLQNRNLKALMQRRLQERLLSRKQKLLDLQQQMQQVHARSAVFTPKCSVLSKYRLKAAGEETLRDEKTFESCMAACRPRDNLAKGKSATSSAFVAAPSLALDGNAATEFRSILAAKPWWQVDLGEVKQVGDVYVSSAISLEGFVVGLRKSAGCPGAATAAGTGAGESEEEPEEESEDEEAELLEELSSQIGKQNSGCAVVTCGIIDANSNFVNCKGEEGRFVVVTSTSTESKTLRITEVEVWEDQVLTRSGGAAAGSIGLASASSPYSNLIDGKTNTPAKSAVGDDLWVHIAVPQDSESIGKISIFPGPDRSVFAPTADKPVLVGFSKSGCSEDGCQKEGTLCGTLKATKNMGPYIVDCGGKEAKFVWLEFPGTGRHIEIGEVEVEKSADCEQVVFTEQGSTKQCLHYAAYSQQSAAPEAGVTYTSAVCHTSGKVGPPGLNGPKGKKGDVGLQGPTGPNGLKGDKGDMGAMGEQGDVGPEGPEGQEADVNGLATMGQLNGAAVLSIVITVAVLVILLQQVGPAKQAPGQKVVEGGEEEEAVEGEEMYAEGEGAGEAYEEGEQPAH